MKPESTAGGGARTPKAPTGLAPPTLADAGALVAREIEGHNAPVFAALAAAGLTGPDHGTQIGSITTMLARFEDLE